MGVLMSAEKSHAYAIIHEIYHQIMTFSLLDSFDDHDTNPFLLDILQKKFNTLADNFISKYDMSFESLMHFIEYSDINLMQSEAILSLRNLLLKKPIHLIVDTIGAPELIDYPYGGPYRWIYKTLIFDSIKGFYEPIYLLIAHGTCLKVGYYIYDSEEGYPGHN